MHRLERKYSVAALSWGAVGKSAIIHRFVMNAFIDLWGIICYFFTLKGFFFFFFLGF